MRRHWTRVLLVVVFICGCASTTLAAPGPGAKKDKEARGEQAEPTGKLWKRYVRYQKRPYLGVHLLGLTQELRAFFKVSGKAGVLVSRVEKGSPADKAGVAVGDVLVAVDGGEVASAWHVARVVRQAKEGQRVKLGVVRKGDNQTLSATLKVRDKPIMEVSRFIFSWPPGGKGARLSRGWDQRAFQDHMEKFQERFDDVAGTENLFKLKSKERQMEKRLKTLEEKIRLLEKKLQGKR